MDKTEKDCNCEKMAQLEKMAQSLVDFLKQNYNPHTSIIITDERVTLVEDVLSIPYVK